MTLRHTLVLAALGLNVRTAVTTIPDAKTLTFALCLLTSLALGTAEVSPLELAVVYSTFANGGLRPTSDSSSVSSASVWLNTGASSMRGASPGRAMM